VNGVLAKYHREYLALERQHTQKTTDAKGHIHVAIEPFADECQALAKRMAAELGGIADQGILPRIEVGMLPPELFGRGGESRVDAELWKENDQYHFRQTLRDWVPAPDMTRSTNSLSYTAPTPEAAFPPEYRIFWKE
jgi:hypothetical protein